MMQTRLRAASSLLALCLLASIPTFAHAQAGAPARPAAGTPLQPSQDLDKILTGIEKEFVPLAEAMPEDKFDFAPTAAGGDFKGVRTFAGQIKHVTEANVYFLTDPPMTPAEFKVKRDAIEKLSSKADIVQAFKDSFTQAHAFMAATTPENAWQSLPNGRSRAGMAAYAMQHMMDHYGQLVVYLRMNGIIPPASRPSK
jgi:hypothetical protein